MNNKMKKALSLTMISLGILPSMFSNAFANEYQDKSKDIKNESISFTDVALGVSLGIGLGLLIHSNNNNSNCDTDGIPNIGNSCYMNAIIQQLYKIKSFYEKIMNDQSGNPKINALKEIFKLLDKKKPIKAAQIRQHIKALGHVYRQEDAVEFLMSIKIGEKDLIDYLDMNNCIFPHFIDSSNPNQTMQNLIDTEYDVEPQNGQFSILISRASHESQEILTRMGNKKAIYKPIKIQTCIKDIEELNIGDQRYILTGVTIHIGTRTTSGHYITLKMDENGQWKIYDDGKVINIDFKQYLKQIESNGVMYTYTAVQ